MKNKQGFTLIELLVVIGIIAILAGVVIVALNPARQFAQARNTQRQSDVLAVLNAVHQRIVDNRGVWSSACGASTVTLPAASTSIGSGVGNSNLDACLVPTYLSAFPVDPSATTAPGNVGYSWLQQADGRIKVFAGSAEVGVTIFVVR